MALGHQHIVRRLTRPWASADSPVVLRKMDTTSDSGSCRVLDSEMSLGSNPDPSVSIVPAQATQISMVSAVAEFSEINMV